MVYVNPWPMSIITVVHGSHRVGYRCTAHDQAWAGQGGPAGPVVLQVVDLTMDWDVDRTPHCRGTVTVVTPQAQARWLSPLSRSLWVTVHAQYWGADGQDWGERALGAFHARRVSHDHQTGETTIDFATYDQEMADRHRKLGIEQA